MIPEQILSHPSKVLSQEQRQDYFDLGYVKVEGLIPKNTLVELRRVIDKVLDSSREESQSVMVFNLGPGHSPQKPLLSQGTFESMEDLLIHLGLDQARLVRIEPTGVEKVGTWINQLSSILII